MKQLIGHFVFNRILKYYERKTIFSPKTCPRFILFNKFNIHRHFGAIAVGTIAILLLNGNFAFTGWQLFRTSV